MSDAAKNTGVFQGEFSRREFLRGSLCTVVVFSMGLKGCADGDGQNTQKYDASGRPEPAAGVNDSRIPIIWIESGICTGCAVSMLSSTQPPMDKLLPAVRLEFQETLSDYAGAQLMARLDETTAAYGGKYVLIVDGAIPTGATARMTVVGADPDGRDITAEDLVKSLSAGAGLIVALGTCASFGGIAGAANNITGSVPLAKLVPAGKQIVRLPGCPPMPQWITLALAAYLSGDKVELDSLGRPAMFYGSTVHLQCPRLAQFEGGNFADVPGDPEKCLYQIGCKGPFTHSDCITRLWHGRSSCVRIGHPCMGCTSPGFPDARSDAGDEGDVASTPFYKPVSL
ncbi:MAG: hydrogenase small subunit [Myxococcota bacterium]|jgi:hydrogenase small subunit